MSTGATPSWKQLNLLSNGTMRSIRSTLVSTRTTLQTVREILNAIQNGVNSISGILSLVRNLETALHRSIYAFLDSIIKDTREFLENLKSTGVYFLDLTSYHLQPPRLPLASRRMPRQWWDTTQASTIDASKNPHFGALQKILNAIGNNSSDQILVDIKQKIESYMYGRSISLNVIELITLASSISNQSIANQIKLYLKALEYKSETYDEFIEVICQSLTDEHDVADSLFTWRALEVSRERTNAQAGETAQEIPSQNTSSIRPEIHSSHWYDMVYRPGAPRFYGDSYMKTMIFGLSVGEITDLIAAIEVLIKIFGESGGFSKNVLDYVQSYSDIVKGFRNNIRPGIDRNRMPLSHSTGRHEPDFYGITANKLLGQLFDVAEQFLRMAESFTLSDKLFIDSITDAVQSVIDKVDTGINRIKQVIQFVEDIIYMIESLMALSQFFMLSVETNEGVADTVNQIRNAKNFMPSIVKDDDIISKFNLDPTPALKMVLNQNRDDQYSLVDNLVSYKSYLQQNALETNVKVEAKKNEYNSLVAKKSVFEIIRDQIIEFESQLAASLYPTNLANFLNYILTRTQLIELYESQYQVLLAVDGNRAWLSNQITNLTNEQTTKDELYTALIADVQAQIEALNPSMIDYSARLADLTAQKSFLQTEKTSQHNMHQDQIDRYTAIKSHVDSFLVFPITNYEDLIPITNKIDDLQDDIDLLISNYDAYMISYSNQRNLYVGQISTDESSITTKQGQISTKQGQIADKTAQLTFLQATDPSNPQIPILIGEIAALNSDITVLNGEIVALQSAIEGLYDDINDLDSVKDSYVASHAKNQIDLYAEQDVYTKWKASETKRLDKYFAQQTFDSEYLTWKTELANYVTSLIEEYIPAFTNSSYTLYVDELRTKHDLKTTYLFVSYSIQNSTVFPVIQLPDSSRVENAIIKLEGEDIYGTGILVGGEISKAEIQKDAFESEYNYYVSQYDKMPSEEALPVLAKEVKEYVDVEQYFDPAKKMYFAGFLVCFGYPNFEDETYINFSSAIGAFETEFQRSGSGAWEEIKNPIEIKDTISDIKYLVKKLGFK
jgi:hypothetical protein